jgi:hypothetical protein
MVYELFIYKIACSELGFDRIFKEFLGLIFEILKQDAIPRTCYEPFESILRIV